MKRENCRSGRNTQTTTHLINESRAHAGLSEPSERPMQALPDYPITNTHSFQSAVYQL